MAERVLVVVRTYNERENVHPLLRELLAQGENVDVWVADDGSPDGTGDAVREVMASQPGGVDLLLRKEKAGRGAAVIAAFKKALADPRAYSVFFEMDADFSHHPRELPKFLAKLETCDMVVGSRYVEGGGSSEWGFWRPPGEKATKVYNADTWLPEETVAAVREYVVSIKGPLTTPVSGGIRSLNAALRQMLDLYVCLRPVRYFSGVPSPVKHPERVDMVIFRENTEDIYAGVEWEAGSAEVKKVIEFLQKEMGVKKIRFPATSGIGVKPVSSEGTKRLVRKAIQYAIDNNRGSVTLVHKGNIMKFTEGAFKSWGYELAKEEFGATEIDKGLIFA